MKPGKNGTVQTFHGTACWQGIFFKIVLFPALFLGIVAAADPLDEWHWSTPLPQGNTLRSVAAGGGLRVAVGDDGTILRSSDGKQFSESPSPTRVHLRGVAHGAGQFVAVGLGGTILRSANGIDWTSINSGTTRDLYAAAYGNNLFVATGANGTLLSSPDGVNWTWRSAGTSSRLNGITCGQGLFIAVGSAGTVLHSADGIRWTNQPGVGPYKELLSVTCGEGLFVATGSPSIFTSTNGFDWVLRNYDTSGSWPGVSYGNGRFLAVGQAALYSTNGISWSSLSLGFAGQGVCFYDGAFTAVGANGAFAKSDDCLVWQTSYQRKIMPSGPLLYENGLFLSAGGPGLLASADGRAWTLVWDGFNTNTYDVACGNNTFVAVGDIPYTIAEARALASSDGIVWTPGNVGGQGGLRGVCFGSGQFVAVGTYGVKWTSPDGTNWTLRTTEHSFALNDVAFGNGLFVAVGASGRVETSSDGIQWAASNIGTNADFWTIGFGGGRFVALASTGIAVSTNGSSWSFIPEVTDGTSVAYGNGVSVITRGGSSGFCFTSTDGQDWVPRLLPTTLPLQASVFGQGRFFLAGGAGMVHCLLESSDLSTLRIDSFFVRNGEAELDILSEVGRAYVLEASTNLTQWSDLTNFISPAYLTKVHHVLPSGLPQHFYRVRSQ